MKKSSFGQPNPDEILNSITENDKKEKKGKLKIFFGMVAGVGKTYQMLLEAHSLQKEGIDIAIGYIETHGRKETELLINGLQLIKRCKISYRDIQIEEMDLDAILLRKPELILVDELAHTNTPGMRHKKRFQDVIEILNNGIDVFTTVNVQHLESCTSTVEEITGIKIYETIPDSVLELADKIELIDIPTEELQKRLHEGKIYSTERAKIALNNFFRKGNLTALREMSLQITAKIVDKELVNYLQENKINNTWKSTERMLVAISPSPHSEYLIRWAKGTVFNLKASWIALYVEKTKIINEKEQNNLNKNIDLARELGAEVIIISDEDIIKGIIRIAKQKNITQIIVGKPFKKSFLSSILKNNIVDKLLKESGDIDIYVVSPPNTKPVAKKKFIKALELISKPSKYMVSFVIIISVTVINLILNKYTGYWSIGIIYMFIVFLIARYMRRGPTLFAAILSAFFWNYLFIPPRFSFYIDKLKDLFMFIMYFIIAIITSGLTTRLHLKQELLEKREYQISKLYEMTYILGTAGNIDDIIMKSLTLLNSFYNSTAAIILTDNTGNLNNIPHKNNNLTITDNEYGVALWCYENRKPAGRFTNTLSVSEIHYLPLITAEDIVGVIAIRFDTNFKLTIEEEYLIKALSRQIASAIKKDNLLIENQNTSILKESEKLYQVILNSVSHELRTPITTISFAASGLMDESLFKNNKAREILVLDIIQAVERLNKTVGNLVDMARIDSGKLKLNMQWYNIEDLISVVLKKLEKELKSYNLVLEITDNLPMIFIDFVLMEQVLTNLILNAVNYSFPQSKIILKIFEKDQNMIVIVKDDGIGLNKEDIPRIFDKFYKSKENKTGGLGLGLSICKSIIEMHKGTIHAENNSEGGASFIIKLSVKSDR